MMQTRCERGRGRQATHVWWLSRGRLELPLCGVHTLAHREALEAAGWIDFDNLPEAIAVAPARGG